MSKLAQLRPGSHIHMMGICGTAMGGLAGLLRQMGYKVTGSDQNVYPPMSTQLRELGITIKEGYKKENLSPKPHFVIVGNVMTKKHEEVEALLELDIPYSSLPEAMGELVIGDKKSIVVAGTHGKTTTTSLMSWVAEVCGKEPGFLIGGKPKDFSMSFRLAKQDFFVIEGDEYDTAFFAKVPKFIYYKPRYTILTSVEFDHADIYKDLDDVKKAFKSLMELVPNNGLLTYHAEDKNIPSLIPYCKTENIQSYGIDKGDFTASSIRMSADFCEFDVMYKNKMIDTVQLTLFGKHNILNALAIYATAKHLAWPNEKIKQALKTFSGVKRRQEIIGRPRDIVVIDDFAHHPTAVRLTLESIHERFKNHNLFAIFEPRSATSRRKVFQKEYTEVFQGPWTVLIAKPFNQVNIPEDQRFSSEELVDTLNKQNTKAFLMEGVDPIIEYVKKHAKPKDVVVIMSNGAFDGIYEKMLGALE